MSAQSKIEWTQTTWNPITGCTKISAGCANCYAERMAKRLKAMGNIRYKNGFDITIHKDLLDAPLKWNTPKIIFVNSMSDIFHEKIPFSVIEKIFSTMKNAPHHLFQILTKRSYRLKELSSMLDWPKNVWMGVTVENNDNISRIDDLVSTPAHVKFISLEPLLGPLTNLNLEHIDWVIVGGESGPNARHMDKIWVTDIRDQCLAQRVPFFFKQWGGVWKKKTGRRLDGQLWDQMPTNSNIPLTI